MKPESIAMGQVLLDHHRDHCCIRADGTLPPRKCCLITYKDLCSQAKVPDLTQKPGLFLSEVAEWCVTNGWPPLPALAVNAESGIPGDNYDGAPGCNILNWDQEADLCIAFRDYPPRIP